jgi:hypothetical protein
VDIRGLFRSACLSRLDPLTAPSFVEPKTGSLRPLSGSLRLLYGEGFSLKVFSTIRRETPRTWRSDSQFWRGTMDGCSECLTVAVLGRCPCKRPLVLRSGQIRLGSTVCFHPGLDTIVRRGNSWPNGLSTDHPLGVRGHSTRTWSVPCEDL